MKILIVSTNDIGGAANACIRLHDGLLKEGINSNVLLAKKRRNVPKTHLLNQKYSFFQKIQLLAIKGLKNLKIYRHRSKEERFITSRSRKLEMFSYPKSNYDITESRFYKEADIINLHWVANFLDYKSFFKINEKPVVWTLHDMNPFTGGEHYEEMYDGIDKKGTLVKRKKTKKETIESDKILEFKKNIYNKIDNLTIVSPSIWLQKEAKSSKAFKDRNVVHIPYGLDKEIFNLKNINHSRDVFQIPKNKKVILFVAESLNNNRKGFGLLIEAFKKLQRDDIVLCAVGNKQNGLNSMDNLIQLGPLNDAHSMSIAYSAADVFIIPSLMDNLPNTVLESIMCGTPVIGFPVGGICDMIDDEVNGYLTNDLSVKSLTKTILKFLENSGSFDRKKIRKLAIEKYDLNIQAKRYIELFSKIKKNHAAN